MSKHDLADISEMAYVDVIAYQKKVSAGSEMKTAIKRFLDDWDLDEPYPVPRGVVRRVKELRKALEAWANADIAEPDEPEVPTRHTISARDPSFGHPFAGTPCFGLGCVLCGQTADMHALYP